jgi:signal transduction histidine kinase
VSCLSNDKENIFSVRDNGLGVTAEEKNRIFEIFAKTKTESDGAGIGLATCKKILKLHGGKIWVESEPGKGSTFYFLIPKGSPRQ